MNEARTNKMETMPMPTLVLNMSLPIMVSLLVQSLYNIVDGMFVARLSEQALTATSLAYPVQMLMIAVGVGTAVGLNSLLSRTLGQKDRQEASQVAMTGLLLSALSAGLFMLAGGLFARDMAAGFTQDAATAAACGEYLYICMVFSLGNLLCMAFQRILQAAGNTFLSMVVLVCGAVINVVLDPVMIFGLLGCPAMGIRGAAWATVIGQWVSMLVGLYFCLRKNPDIPLSFRGFSLRIHRIRAIYKVGLPAIITQGLNSVMVTAFNAILLPLSSTAVAFFGIYNKLQSFLFMPMSGLGQALVPIVGYNYGANRKDRVVQSLRVAYPAAAAIALAGTALFCLLGRSLLGLFSAGADMLALGIPALRALSLIFLFAAVTNITGYFASGLGDGTTNMVGSVLRQFFPLLPCAQLLAGSGGIGAVWYSFWISEAIATLFALVRLRQLMVKKELSVPAPSLDRAMEM